MWSHYIITASTVKKSVSKRRGGRARQPLREANDDHSVIEDLSPAKQQSTLQSNKIMQSH